MKYIFMTLICFSTFLFSNAIAEDEYKIKVICELQEEYIIRTGVKKEHYDNTWILNFDIKNSFFSILDTHAGAEFRTDKNNSLTYLGKYGDNLYHLILENSGWTYVYKHLDYNSNKVLELYMIDPRGKANFRYAKCKNLY
jgi:hypothetical protein